MRTLPEGPLGARVVRRLRDETLIWLITVAADGTPQPNPVWFLWEGTDEVVIYTKADAVRLAHVAARPQVALHLQASAEGGDVIVLTGTARISDALPPPDENEAYVAKYRSAMERVSGSMAEFGVEYPIPMTVQVSRVRGF